jgi:hypothetical protein
MRLTPGVRGQFVPGIPDGYLPLDAAAKAFGCRARPFCTRSDPPRGVRGGLLAREQTGAQPPVDGALGDVELAGGLVDGEDPAMAATGSGSGDRLGLSADSELQKQQVAGGR